MPFTVHDKSSHPASHALWCQMSAPKYWLWGNVFVEGSSERLPSRIQISFKSDTWCCSDGLISGRKKEKEETVGQRCWGLQMKTSEFSVVTCIGWNPWRNVPCYLSFRFTVLINFYWTSQRKLQCTRAILFIPGIAGHGGIGVIGEASQTRETTVNEWVYFSAPSESSNASLSQVMTPLVQRGFVILRFISPSPGRHI